MSTPPRSPWRMTLPLLAVIAIFVLWSIYWFTAIHFAKGKAAEARATLAAQGTTLTCARETWGGYPFRFEFTCMQPALSLQDGSTAHAAQAEALAQSYMPRHVMLLIDGPTTVALRGHDPLTASHDRAVTSLNLGTPALPVIIAEVHDLKVETFGGAERALVSYRKRPGEFEDLAIDVTTLRIDLPGHSPLTFDRMTADASAEARRNFTLRAAEAVAGKLSLTASGAATLDDQRRPQGQIDTTLNDPTEAAKMIASLLALKPEQQSAITAALSLFGGKATLTARDGVLSLGPLPIGTLRPLD